MGNLFNSHDGADHQAAAVRAFLGSERYHIEESWDDYRKRYAAEPLVARWHNGREQGYVITMRGPNYMRQINIAFYEHRNSDSICAVVWEQMTFNPPTIESRPEGVMKDKWDVSHTVGYGRIREMADWIFARLEEFWASCVTESKGATHSA